MGRLFWKIFFGFWLTLVVTGTVVGGAVYLHNQVLRGDDGFSTDRRAEFLVGIAANALQFGDEAGAQALFKQWPGNRPTSVMIVDAKGRDILGKAVPQGALRHAIKALRNGDISPSLRQVTTASGKQFTLFVPAANVDIAAPLRYRLPPPETQILIALFASLLFSAAFASYLSHPIRHLRQASRRLADGQLDTRVGPHLGKRNDEMADLGQDFDYMATRLQTLLNAQRQLLHDVSHELRSPVARMRLAVGLAQQQPEKLDAVLNRIERETERLDELLGQMLTLSRLESGITAETQEKLSLNELLEEIVQDVNFEAQAVGGSVSFQATTEIVMNGHYELLRRAFENVIRNALKYNAPGAAVEVVLYREASGKILVEVRDHGQGLAENELDAVFQPFYRVSGMAKAGTAGYGLGLAIAKRAIERHQGSINLSNCADGGLCVKIQFRASETAGIN